MNDQIRCNSKLAPEEVNKVSKKFAQRIGYGKEFIDNDKWYSLSNFQKFSKKFKFKDYSQNPPRAWWNTFTDKEKEEVVKLKLEWQKRRLVELAELYEKDQDLAIRFIDSFMFYEERDKFGFSLEFSEELKELKKLDQDSQLIYDELLNTLNVASERNLVYNKVMHNNKPVNKKGLSALNKINKDPMNHPLLNNINPNFNHNQNSSSPNENANQNSSSNNNNNSGNFH